MSTSATFAAKGLGVILILDDDGDIIGGGGYGPGFDGRFAVLEFQDGNSSGDFDVYMPSGKESTGEWPQQEDYTRTPVGSATLSLSPDRNVLTMAYTLDRYALGWPKVEFSPTPPSNIEGGVMLNRLA